MATGAQGEAIEVDCVKIEDRFDLLQKEFYKEHMYLAHRKGTEDKVLLVRLKTNEFDIQSRKEYIKMLVIMCVNHRLPSMVKFDRIIQDGLNVYLVQRFNQFGVLKDLMQTAFAKGKPFQETFVKRWLAHLVLAVYSLHERKIAHGSLHVLNLYMDEDRLSVGPVEGFSRVLEDPKTFAGKGDIWKTNELDDLERANHTSPEVIKGMMPGPKNDIWCIGVIAHFMTCMVYPFQSGTPQRVLDKVKTKNPTFHNFSEYHFSEELKEWITSCLEKDEKTKRPNIAALYNSDYLKATIEGISLTQSQK